MTLERWRELSHEIVADVEESVTDLDYDLLDLSANLHQKLHLAVGRSIMSEPRHLRSLPFCVVFLTEDSIPRILVGGRPADSYRWGLVHVWHPCVLDTASDGLRNLDGV